MRSISLRGLTSITRPLPHLDLTPRCKSSYMERSVSEQFASRPAHFPRKKQDRHVYTVFFSHSIRFYVSKAAFLQYQIQHTLIVVLAVSPHMTTISTATNNLYTPISPVRDDGVSRSFHAYIPCMHRAVLSSSLLSMRSCTPWPSYIDHHAF